MGMTFQQSYKALKEERMVSSPSIHPRLAASIEEWRIQTGLEFPTEAELKRVILPLVGKIAEAADAQRQMLIVGLAGAQGSGKSTYAELCRRTLEEAFQLRTAVISLDDLYLDRKARSQVAEKVHPLFQTRGVPGTHDIGLGLELIKRLRKADDSTKVYLPRFDKSEDNPRSSGEWPIWQGRCDVLIIEGWCVGARAQRQSELAEPVNELERDFDPDGKWRHFVNRMLATEYQTLFTEIDVLTMLKVPSMSQVFEWRELQESKLRASAEAKGAFTMSKEQVQHFVMHFERITRFMLEEMPSRADLLVRINADHCPEY